MTMKSEPFTVLVTPPSLRLSHPVKVWKNSAPAVAAAQARPSIQGARVFRAPPRPMFPRASVATAEVPSPGINLPLNPPVPAAAARLPVLPPPLKTDNLASLAPVTQPPVRGEIKTPDFGAASAARGYAAERTPSETSGFPGATIEKIASPLPLHPVHAGFGDLSVASLPPSSGRAQNTGAQDTSTTPVEILEKPRPRYTEEARRLRLEGEVILETLFPAAGPPRVLHVVRGLGNGLDESAIAAAQAIRFRPAMRAGQAVDTSATVHIVFQIAY